MKPIDKILEDESYKDNLEKCLKESFVDMTVSYKQPENCILIKNAGQYQRLLTMGNISTIQGKQKSKKSLLSSMLTAFATGANEIGGKFKTGFKDKVCFYFDTEQAIYDSYKIGKIIEGQGGKLNNLNIISLREYSPKDRLEIINYAVEKYGKEIGYIVIDGIADLVNSINDELEAVDVTTRLMRWTKLHEFHISVIIHQRKGDNYARGHIGSALMNKSEAVISVTKDENFREKSVVRCEDIRGTAPFDDFEIMIDNNGLTHGDIGYKAENIPF